jgi:SPP1 family predicted phage head-tail adaptor
MTYRTGELDQRVKVLRQSLASDGMGGSSLDWVEVSEIWAHVRPKGGREVTEFDRVNGQSSYLFVVRNGLDVRDSDALEWDGVRFNITTRKQPSRRALYLEIDAERGVAL